MTLEERALAAYYDRLTVFPVEKSRVIVINFLSEDPELAARAANAIADTYLQLQRTVEALSGVRLHKQNIRRLVEHQGLVEETGGISAETGGRPARLVRFRREVLLERPAPGLRLRAGRRVTVS